MYDWQIPLTYLLSSVLFIFSIRSLSSPKTAVVGNLLGMIGMSAAVLITLFSPYMQDKQLPLLVIISGAIIGIYTALKVKMTALPQMIAALNGLGGLAAVFISFSELITGSSAFLEITLGMVIGAIAFSGSLIAFAKLQGILPSRALTFKYQHVFNFILISFCIYLALCFLSQREFFFFYLLSGLALILGIMIVLPIGGADMPVVISLLNSYSGWAAVGIGFSIGNVLLIIVGSLVGASGAILSYIMVKAMNRSLLNVLLGGFGSTQDYNTSTPTSQNAKSGSPQDAAFIMENARKIIIVPGYGMAVSQAQHVLQKMAEDLRSLYDVEVKFAIHPVAGRMPGHMNVLLAEANVDYANVYGLEEINHEFTDTDVAYVIGANDITNPQAKNDPSSPLYGMPVLDVAKAKTIFFVKRSLSTGYAGTDNPLFYAPNTIMLYGDAKKITEEIVRYLEKK